MRRQLILMTLAVTSIIVVAFVLPLAILVRTIASNRAITHANADAQYVGQIVAANRAGAPAVVAQADTSTTGRISVFYADGSVVGDRSRPPDADSLRLARRGRSFSRSWSGGVDVFQPVLGAAGRSAVVRVDVPNSALHRGVVGAWWSLAGLGVALIALGVFVADRMARTITKPMQTLTDIARRLASGDLGARSQVRGPPEVVEVSRALDALAARIGDLLSAERERAADLSHSLRTPLTALRLDAELLADKAEAARITAAVDDLEDAVTNVIADTRRERTRGEQPDVDLGEIVRERLAFWEVLTRAQERILEIRLHTERVPVAVHRHELEELVDVLVGNVLRHTIAGCALRVTTEPGSDGGGRLVVEDAGAGFHGGGTATAARSSGRGLEIARRIASGAGGTLTLGVSDLGGACVDVELAPPPA